MAERARPIRRLREKSLRTENQDSRPAKSDRSESNGSTAKSDNSIATATSASSRNGSDIDTEMLRKLTAEVLPVFENDPGRPMHAIVTALEDLDALLESLPDQIMIEHQFRLIKGVSIKASAADLMEVAHLPGVRSIESVKSVATC